MDYKERKIKGVLRELIIKSQESLFDKAVKKLGNPYAALENVSINHDKVNQLLDEAYKNIKEIA